MKRKISFKNIFKRKRIGLYFESMTLIVDEVQNKYNAAFKVKEVNCFGDDVLISILDVFSMDRKPYPDYIKSLLKDKAPKIVKMSEIKWEKENNS